MTFSRLYCNSLTHKCWNCGSSIISKVICENCNVVQQPQETTNYYNIFELKEEFNIDRTKLALKYRSLQTVLHPDKFSNKSEQEKVISADYSALVNKAYDTLHQPLKRAIHLLQLRGVKIEENQNITDAALLLEIMDLNEEIEDAKEPTQLRRINEKNRDKIRQLCEEVDKHFRNNDIVNAKETIVKMKYYYSLHNRINGILREEGIVD